MASDAEKQATAEGQESRDCRRPRRRLRDTALGAWCWFRGRRMWRNLRHGDLYAAYEPGARRLKTALQMLIGAAAVVIIAAHFAVAAVAERLPKLTDATTQLLGGIGIALAAAAVVELAYTLFTPGPDEALDPLMLGLAAALLLLVGGLDSGVGVDRAAALLLLGVLLAGLFGTRLYLAESKDTPDLWWLRGDHRRAGEDAAPDASATRIPLVDDHDVDA